MLALSALSALSFFVHHSGQGQFVGAKAPTLAPLPLITVGFSNGFRITARHAAYAPGHCIALHARKRARNTLQFCIYCMPSGVLGIEPS